MSNVTLIITYLFLGNLVPERSLKCHRPRTATSIQLQRVPVPDLRRRRNHWHRRLETPHGLRGRLPPSLSSDPQLLECGRKLWGRAAAEAAQVRDLAIADAALWLQEFDTQFCHSLVGQWGAIANCQYMHELAQVAAHWGLCVAQGEADMCYWIGCRFWIELGASPHPFFVYMC